jgi:hypothetical protein
LDTHERHGRTGRTLMEELYRAIGYKECRLHEKRWEKNREWWFQKNRYTESRLYLT